MPAYISVFIYDALPIPINQRFFSVRCVLFLCFLFYRRLNGGLTVRQRAGGAGEVFGGLFFGGFDLQFLHLLRARDDIAATRSELFLGFTVSVV